VRRGKGALIQWEEDIPSGNSCSSRKQSERGVLVTARDESLRCKRTRKAGSASTQPLMRMNTEEASKRAMRTPSLLKQDEGRRLNMKRATRAMFRAAGVLVRGCEQRINAVNTGGPSWWGARPQLKNREVWHRPGGESERFIVAKNRVTIEEPRDLSSRSTLKQQEPGRLMSV
jgi:hypothetical protein